MCVHVCVCVRVALPDPPHIVDVTFTVHCNVSKCHCHTPTYAMCMLCGRITSPHVRMVLYGCNVTVALSTVLWLDSVTFTARAIVSMSLTPHACALQYVLARLCAAVRTGQIVCAVHSTYWPDCVRCT